MASKLATSDAAEQGSPEAPKTTQLEQAPKIDVSLRGVAETLLIPLAARSSDAASQDPILADSYAAEVLKKLDYDFSKVFMPPRQSLSVVLRTKLYDRWTASFLAANPRATVLHLACGLDSRAQRVKWGSDVRWIDVDLPEVVSIRRQVLPEFFPGREYRLVGADVVADVGWLEEIAADRPTVVVMEGLLGYFTDEDAKGLLSRLVERFQQGELLFESLNPSGLAGAQTSEVKAVHQTGAKIQWALQDPKSLEELSPHLKLAESIRFSEVSGVERLPFATRVILYVLSWLPGLRDSVRFVRFKFDKSSA